MCCSHRDHGRPPHDLVDGGPGVGELGHVIHARQTVPIHHGSNFFLDLSPHLRVVDHEEDRPLQGCLQSLNTSGEDIKDDLLELPLRVLVEHLVQVTGLLSALHLNEIVVHEVPGGVSVDGVPMVLDDVADKLQHLVTIFLQVIQG